MTATIGRFPAFTVIRNAASGTAVFGNASLRARQEQQNERLLRALEARDPEKAKLFRQSIDNTRNTIKQLENAKTDLHEQRKEAARQKIEQLKAQLRALRLQTVSGDPKIVAREAARLARELASAVRDYAGAGGMASLTMGTPTAPDNGGDTEIGVEKAAVQQAIARQTEADNAARASGEADANFAREARGVLQELKRLLKEARDKLRQQGDEDEKGAGRATDTLRDAEKDIAAIEQAAIAIIAQPPAAEATGPALDIAL